MELRVQLEKWATEAESADMESVADMGVAIRLLNHGIESLDQLEAVKQRELELLAVIENIQTAFKFAAEMAAEGDDSDIRMAHVKMLDALYAEPSQALREHEAMLFDAVAKHCGAYGDKLIREHNAFSESKIAHELRVYYERMAEERRKK